ncbi:hypothetical protein ACFX13_033282 [Malus domestica]
MPNAFTDLALLTRSHIPATNVPAKIDVPNVRNEMIFNDALAYAVVTEIMLSDDIEPRSIDECRHRTDWSN